MRFLEVLSILCLAHSSIVAVEIPPRLPGGQSPLYRNNDSDRFAAHEPVTSQSPAVSTSTVSARDGDHDVTANSARAGPTGQDGARSDSSVRTEDLVLSSTVTPRVTLSDTAQPADSPPTTERSLILNETTWLTPSTKRHDSTDAPVKNSTLRIGSKKKELSSQQKHKTLHRQRPEPGLAPGDLKPSSRRNGVLDIETLDSHSKPRKGVSYTITSPAAPSSNSTPGSSPLPNERHWEYIAVSASVVHGTPLTTTKIVLLLLLAVALLALAVCIGVSVYRRVVHLWNHRHYRKMDFLVDGMYNL